MLFTEKGPSGTGATLKRLQQEQRAENQPYCGGVKYRRDGKAPVALAPGIHVACITHHTGFRKPGEQEMSRQVREN